MFEIGGGGEEFQTFDNVRSLSVFFLGVAPKCTKTDSVFLSLIWLQRWGQFLLGNVYI